MSPQQHYTLDSLKTLRRWCTWQEEQRGLRRTKVPYGANGFTAESNKPTTWLDHGTATRFAAALQQAADEKDESFVGGIGVFLGDLGDSTFLTGVDFDSCIGDNGLEPWAVEGLEVVASYAEESPSHTGVKAFVLARSDDIEAIRAAIGADTGKRTGKGWKEPGVRNHPKGIEVYLEGRFFAFTGDDFGMHPPVLGMLDSFGFANLRGLAEETFGRRESANRSTVQPSEVSDLSVAEAAQWRPALARILAGDLSDLGSDKSRSAVAFRLGAELKQAGIGREAIFTFLSSFEITASWVTEKGITAGQRELNRLWDHASGPPFAPLPMVEGESSTNEPPPVVHRIDTAAGGNIQPLYEAAKTDPNDNRPARVPPDVDQWQPSGSLLLDPEAPLDTARTFVAMHYTVGDMRTLHHLNGTFFDWAQSHYREVEPEHLQAIIGGAFLDSAWRLNTKGNRVRFRPQPKNVADVVAMARIHAQIRRDVAAPAWLKDSDDLPPASDVFATANGLLHISSGRLIPHTPEFFNHNAVSYNYDPEATACPTWESFLHSIWPDDQEAITTLQDIAGYLLTAETKQQKMFMLIGPPRSGKGTIARVLTEMLGAWNVAGPTLSSMASQFGLMSLLGKPLAVIADARLDSQLNQQTIVERLLSISGEDSIDVDRKNQTIWTGKLPTRIMILSNIIPRLADSSNALSSRFIMLTMSESFIGREDKNLIDHLKSEMPSILNWAIIGRRRLAERGHFLQPTSADEAIEEMRDLSSPVGAFVRACLEPRDGGFADCAEVFSAWRTWASINGRAHAGSVQSFSRDLRAAIPSLKVVRHLMEGNRPRGYEGIILRGPSAANAMPDGGVVVPFKPINVTG